MEDQATDLTATRAIQLNNKEEEDRESVTKLGNPILTYQCFFSLVLQCSILRSGQFNLET